MDQAFIKYKKKNNDHDMMKTNDLIHLIPIVSLSSKEFNYDFSEIQIACVEYSEGPVGCTLVYFPKGGQCYIDERGANVGVSAYPTIRSDGLTQGVCIAGGSIMGLECVTGVNAEIWKQNNYERRKFGIVSSSNIFSSNLKKNSIYPDKELGRFAFRNLINHKVYLGQVGAGRSASYGQGCAMNNFKEYKIFCLVVVNALGKIHKGDRVIDHIIKNDSYFEETNKNTTICVLVIDMKLTYNQLRQLGKQCHTSIADVIKPFNTIFDGDTFYACTTESKEMINLTKREMYDFYITCSSVVKEAILNCI
jgi:6-aminohexanoate-oligomer endohydrolase